jgi:hypothetical protein
MSIMGTSRRFERLIAGGCCFIAMHCVDIFMGLAI